LQITGDYYQGAKADRVSLRTAFDGYDGTNFADPATGTAILPTTQMAAALALTNIWYAQWAQAALTVEAKYIGDVNNQDAATYAASQYSLAVAAETLATTN